MRTFSVSALFLLFALAVQPAQGAIFFSYGVDGSDPLPTNDITVFVGEVLTISVFFEEDDTPGPDTRLSDDGVLSFDFIAEYETTFGEVTATQHDLSFPNFAGSTFDNNAVQPFLRIAGTAPGVTDPFNPNTDGVLPDPGDRFVELGTFTFQTNTVGSTDFEFMDPFPAPSEDNRLGAPSEAGIDAEIFGAIPAPIFTVNAVAIPEPSSVVAIATIFGIAAVGARRRRHRRRAQKDRPTDDAG